MLFIDLCRLRAAPQDLPCSHFLMLLTIICYLLAGLAISLLDQRFGLALLSASVDTAMLVGFTYLGLWMLDRRARAVQATTALCGTGTLFALIGWPLMAQLQELGDTSAGSLSLLLLALVVWNIAVIGNILRHALELPLWIGTGVALLYVYTSLRVMSALHVAGNMTGNL
jgi:hypothetical protein